MAEAADRPTTRRGEPKEDELRRYLDEGARYTSSDDDDRKRPSGGIALGSVPWKVGLLVVAGVAMLGWLVMRFAVSPGESIQRIRHYPAEFKDRPVVLRGRVGEVFEVGGSYAFNLQQGHDTIVVFTRGARPLEQSQVEVHGSVSIGYLDGAPRPSIFESERR